VDEFFVENWVNPVVDEMVDYPVSEIGGYYFAFYWEFVYEAYAGLYFVGSVQ
jgi:hypothetical protein